MTTGEANGILSTWGHFAAWVNALFLHACSVVRAFPVKVTLHSTALYKRITFQSGQTATHGAMLLAVTLGVQRARIFQGTRIQTFAIEALLIVGAFAVGAAAQLEATELSIS